ncbi:MAG: glycosyltransferase family 4 protein [Phycisphaerae bacterium]|nr:glycosyltransferase family 4 protein [Phycisphaerae bacterium]
MSRLKILMLNHEFPPVGGGASPVTYDLCRHLAQKGHQVDVVTMHFKGTPREACMDGVRVFRTPAIRKRADICHAHELATFYPGALIKALQLTRTTHYDIIHCHFLVPGGPLAWLVSRWRRIPLLVTCHGTDVPEHNPERFQWMHKLIGPAWRFLARHADQITSPSEYLKTAIHRACPDARVQVIPNGITLNRFEPGPKKKQILMCSRLLAFKGFQHVIEAVKDLDLDWTVHIIGDGPYLPELKRLAGSSITPIQFTGWLDKTDPEFVALYRESAIFVFPSEAENFPTVLLEAMSARMAIISSTAGGCREVVGDAGMYVSPGDVAGIRESIVKLIESDSERERLAQAALERAGRFGWDTIADQFIETYQGLMQTT